MLKLDQLPLYLTQPYHRVASLQVATPRLPPPPVATAALRRPPCSVPPVLRLRCPPTPELTARLRCRRSARATVCRISMLHYYGPKMHCNNLPSSASLLTKLTNRYHTHERFNSIFWADNRSCKICLHLEWWWESKLELREPQLLLPLDQRDET